MTEINLYEELAGRRLLTAFERWVKDQGEKIGRRTLYRAKVSGSATPTQRRAVKLAEKYLSEKSSAHAE